MVAENRRNRTVPGGARDLPKTGSQYLMAARGISKIYRNGGVRIEILKRLDLSLRSGESVAVVGASGIGKSGGTITFSSRVFLFCFFIIHQM